MAVMTRQRMVEIKLCCPSEFRLVGGTRHGQHVPAAMCVRWKEIDDPEDLGRIATPDILPVVQMVKRTPPDLVPMLAPKDYEYVRLSDMYEVEHYHFHRYGMGPWDFCYQCRS